MRSRFSFRRILLAPPVADVQAAPSFRDALRLEETQETTREIAKRRKRERAKTTKTKKKKSPSPRGPPPRSGRTRDVQRRAGRRRRAAGGARRSAKVEALECTPRAVGDLACLVISRMDRDVGLVTARDIAAATQTLLADTYVKSLAGASTLELCLVVAMSRLHRFRRMPRFNFNHVENEMRAMAANDFLGDAGRAKGAVLLRAFENLLTAGACEAPGGSAGGALGGAGGARGAARRGRTNSSAGSSCLSRTRRWRRRWRCTPRSRRGSRSCSRTRACARRPGSERKESRSQVGPLADVCFFSPRSDSLTV